MVGRNHVASHVTQVTWTSLRTPPHPKKHNKRTASYRRPYQKHTKYIRWKEPMISSIQNGWCRPNSFLIRDRFSPNSLSAAFQLPSFLRARPWVEPARRASSSLASSWLGHDVGHYRKIRLGLCLHSQGSDPTLPCIFSTNLSVLFLLNTSSSLQNRLFTTAALGIYSRRLLSVFFTVWETFLERWLTLEQVNCCSWPTSRMEPR